MPRLPVDGKKVIEYRITLGAKERELVQDAQWSYTFGQIGSTVSGVMGNPAILLGLAAYMAYKLDQILDPDWRAIVADMTPDQISDWLETQNLVGAGIGGFLGLFVGHPIIGAILGSLVVEGGEAAFEAGVEMGEGIDETFSQRNAVNAVLWFMTIERTLAGMAETVNPFSNGENGGGGGGGF